MTTNPPTKRGIGGILYGDIGVGKTSFALQFRRPLKCISVRESGFADLLELDPNLEGISAVSADNFSDLLAELEDADDQATVVVDSLSGISQFMRTDILKHCYSGTTDNRIKGFASFSEGWRIHGPIWMERLEERCEYLRSKGVNVILIGHVKIEKNKNIISNDYQAAMLDMESWPRAVITKWAQAVLFMTIDFSVKSTKKWKGKTTESKVEEELDESVARVMYTTKHPSHSAKNRLNLPLSIDMGESAEEAFTNFKEALPPIMRDRI